MNENSGSRWDRVVAWAEKVPKVGWLLTAVLVTIRFLGARQSLIGLGGFVLGVAATVGVLLYIGYLDGRWPSSRIDFPERFVLKHISPPERWLETLKTWHAGYAADGGFCDVLVTDPMRRATKAGKWTLQFEKDFTLTGVAFRWTQARKADLFQEIPMYSDHSAIWFKVPQCEKGDRILTILSAKRDGSDADGGTLRVDDIRGTFKQRDSKLGEMQ